jgi:hypothetical protein
MHVGNQAGQKLCRSIEISSKVLKNVDLRQLNACIRGLDTGKDNFDLLYPGQVFILVLFQSMEVFLAS